MGTLLSRGARQAAPQESEPKAMAATRAQFYRRDDDAWRPHPKLPAPLAEYARISNLQGARFSDEFLRFVAATFTTFAQLRDYFGRSDDSLLYAAAKPAERLHPAVEAALDATAEAAAPRATEKPAGKRAAAKRAPAAAPFPFAELPVELQALVLSYCDTPTLLRCCGAAHAIAALVVEGVPNIEMTESDAIALMGQDAASSSAAALNAVFGARRRILKPEYPLMRDTAGRLMVRFDAAAVPEGADSNSRAPHSDTARLSYVDALRALITLGPLASHLTLLHWFPPDWLSALSPRWRSLEVLHFSIDSCGTHSLARYVRNVDGAFIARVLSDHADRLRGLLLNSLLLLRLEPLEALLNDGVVLPNVEQISLDHCLRLRSGTTSLIRRLFPNLRAINLTSMPFIDDDELPELEHMPLETLRLGDSDAFSGESLTKTLANLTQLRHFSVSGSVKSSAPLLAPLSRRLVSLEYCVPYIEEQEQYLAEFTQLEDLSLTMSLLERHNVTLPSSLRSLTSTTYSMAHALTNLQHVEALFAPIGNLERLSLATCSTDAVLAILRLCPKLKTLRIDVQASADFEVMPYLTEFLRLAPNLEEVSLRCAFRLFKLPEDAALMFVTELPRLLHGQLFHLELDDLLAERRRERLMRDLVAQRAGLP